MQTDAELIHRCRDGHPDAFRQLVDRYQAEAFGHALTLLGHREDALDALQDSFLSAFRALDRFDVSREFYPWLYVILRNRCYKQFDVRKRRGEVGSVGLEQCQLVVAPESGSLNDLEDAMWALRPQDREILMLKHFEGLKYAELADRLSIPQGTVMSRLYHARQRLRELLEDRDEVSIEKRSAS